MHWSCSVSKGGRACGPARPSAAQRRGSARSAGARHRTRDPLERLIDLVRVGGLDAQTAVVLAHLIGELLREPPPRGPKRMLGVEVGDARRVDEDQVEPGHLAHLGRHAPESESVVSK